MKLAWVLALCVACGRPPAPRAPSVDVRAEIEQAETAEKARKHDVARVHYERAVANARSPESISYARLKYADTLRSWGEYPAAIVQLEGAIAAKPDDAGAWHDLGLFRNNQGNTAGAIAALERSRELAPRDLRPRVALAALRWKLGDRANAAVEYRKLLELELPESLRVNVEWAITALAAIERGDPVPPPPRESR